MRTDEEVRELIDGKFAWLFDNYVLEKADIVQSAGVDREWDLVVSVKFFIAPEPLLNPLSELGENNDK